jgi:putative glutamine amidotransferase
MNTANRVVIGLTTEVLSPPWYDGRRRYQLFTDYSDCLRAAGAIPVLIPGDTTPADLPSILARLDGVLAAGGDDVDLREMDGPAPTAACKPIPAAQQQMNLALIERVIDLDMPLLAVCLGMQVMGLAHGAAYIQHLDAHQAHTSGVRHQVQPTSGSRLAQVLGTDQAFEVPSFHHQALTDPCPLPVSARADDGTIEAIELAELDFALGVQWHPERDPDSATSQALFSRFVAAADAYRRRSR